MSNGHKQKYKNGNKNNWRNWQWNRIAERLLVAPRDANVIYLAGKDNLDAAAACRHGFKQGNMIAIEINGESLESLRDSGVTTIRGDLASAIAEWGRDRIDVVVADFCSGITSQVMMVGFMSQYNPCFRDCVFSVNLQRGREFWGEGQQLFKNIIQTFGKHRGELFSSITRAEAIDAASGNSVVSSPLEHIKKFTTREGNNSIISERMNSVFNSYRSESGMYFDSVVYVNPSYEWLRVKNSWLSKYAELCGDEISFDGPGTYEQYKNFCAHKTDELFSKINWNPESMWNCKSKKIVAAKAIRNRRSAIYRN